MTDRPGPTPADGAETKAGDLLRNEQDIQARLAGQPFDFPSLLAVSNIYRAAAAVRRRAERHVLGPRNLSWGGFTIMFVLWIWGRMETARLAAECDLAKGTLTGMVSTLERRGLVVKERVAADMRRVEVALTADGDAMMEELFPEFNRFEADVTAALSDDEKKSLASLLRSVIHTAGGEDDEQVR